MSAVNALPAFSETALVGMDGDELDFLSRLVEAAQAKQERATLAADAWAGIYVRRSPRSRDAANERSVTEQEEACREALARFPEYADLDVKLYCDNDLSAADETKLRPDWERLRRDIRGGHLRVVFAWDQSRLTRAKRGRSTWGAFRDLCETGGTEAIRFAADEDVTLADGASGLGSDFKAVMHAEYVRGLKANVNRTLKRRVRDGLPKGGIAPYGYDWGDDEDGNRTFLLDEVRARVVREAARRLLDGETAAGICRDFERRGVPTAQGGRWSASMLRRLLQSPRIAGFHASRAPGSRHRLVTGDRGSWEPILTEETWLAVQRVFTTPTPGNGGTRERRPFKKHLLSGILRCGRCGGKMSGVMLNAPGPKGSVVRRHYYSCAVPARGGCGMKTAFAPEIERAVGDRAKAICADPALLALVTADEHADARAAILAAIREAEADEADLVERAGAGRMRPAMVERISAAIDERLAGLRADLGKLAPPPELDYAAIAATWESPDASVDLKRTVLVALFRSVTFAPPGGPGRKTWDAERLTIVDNLPAVDG